MALHTALSQPIGIASRTAPNRIVMPPLVIWESDQSGAVVEAHLQHYSRSLGPGLVIVEATTVAPAGRLARTQLGIWDDSHVAGLSALADVVHGSGSLAGIQIHHAGGSSSLEKNYGLSAQVPSLLDASPDGAEELSDGDIDSLVLAFGDATARAVAAGFDVVELHGAHGYLISQFLSPGTNRRTDRWGGTAENRRRFLLSVIAEARRRIDASARREEVALAVRLGVAASGSRRLPLSEGLAAAEAVVAAGVDLVDVSNAGGIDEDLEAEIRAQARSVVGTDAADRFTPTMLLAALVRPRIAVPVIGVNGIRTVEEAQGVVDSEVADMVAVGRGILADPAWARKALSETEAPIETCRHCKPRCFWFGDPPKCPARRALARRGEQPALS